MMHYVYVIQNEKNNSLYFGKTDNLERRLSEHNGGRNLSTARGSPSWRYVYVEGYRSAIDASDRELQLKDYGNARTYVKRRIRNSLL